MMDNDQMLTRDLEVLREKGNFRQLPSVEHLGRWVRSGEQPMLNLSSNDYLGLATDESLRKASWRKCQLKTPSSPPPHPVC